AFNFSESVLRDNIGAHIDHLNVERERLHALVAAGARGPVERLLVTDSTKGAWSRPNIADLRRNRRTSLDDKGFRRSQYRPFMKQYMYLDRAAKLTEMLYQIPKIWPTVYQENCAIVIPAGASAADFMPTMYDEIPAL